MVSFTLAVNRRQKVQGQADADFINCVAWNHSADFMANYIRKGALLGVDGRIQVRSYDDRDGKKVYVTEVIAEHVQSLESRREETTLQLDARMGETFDRVENTIEFTSDDLPF